MTRLVRRAIGDLAGELAAQAGVDPSQICEMSLVGQLGHASPAVGPSPWSSLARRRFVACLGSAVDIKARELGLRLAPGAYVHLPPLVGGFVGSDNVAMIMGADLDRPGPVRLGLDIGTNTEVVITAPNGGHAMFIASAPSGPTFEGAHLSSGMRAMAGAISKVEMREDQPVCFTIDGDAPAGVCGSGIIDAVARLLEAGVINSRGHLDRKHPRVRADQRSISYILGPCGTVGRWPGYRCHPNGYKPGATGQGGHQRCRRNPAGTGGPGL